MTSSKQTSLIPGDAQQIVSVLQQIGRCTPILGASIESLCGLVLMIASKIDEMKNARAEVRNLVEDVLKVATCVCQILQNYCGAEREDDELVQKLDCFVKSIEDAVMFIGVYLRKRAYRRFLDSTSDGESVKELRRSMYDNMHSFMLATTAHIYLGVKALKRKMSAMTKEVQITRVSMQETHRSMQEVLHLQREGQKRSEELLQTVQRSASPFSFQSKEFQRRASETSFLDFGDDSEDEDEAGADLRDGNAEKVPDIVREHEPPPFETTVATINARIQSPSVPTIPGKICLCRAEESMVAVQEMGTPCRGNHSGSTTTLIVSEFGGNYDRRLLSHRINVAVHELECAKGVFKETEERGGRWDVNRGKFKTVKIIISTTRKVFGLF